MRDVTYYLSPAFEHLRSSLEKLLEIHLRDGDIVLLSSGTTNKVKGYIFERTALEMNAKSVNDYYKITPDDTWAQSLPLYHISGLSIKLRAELSQSKVYNLRPWSLENFKIAAKEISIISLVPTQLHDIVKNKISCSSSIRHVILGGDFTPEDLLIDAKNLGYPVTMTYGMTEVGSHLGVKTNFHDGYRPLDVHEIKVSDDGRLMVKSPSHARAMFVLDQGEINITTYDRSEFQLLDDQVRIENGLIFPMGRLTQEFKSSGHLFSWSDCYALLKNELYRQGIFEEAEPVLLSDAREGFKIIVKQLESSMISLQKEKLSALIQPQKVSEIQRVKELPKTELGKVKRS